ncbi:Ldh family oxidoreductase [Carboxydochorda subterranea]|uniref:Ldh family oxidoreductase n=1 Tax=Carboxydichorda subterranea TaxID=3109565 RepID=A0ABZ1BVS6_9FIRM|nr:Ldh family oxidoreductase [Limnochorda sp. L945t]WRP16776.1 Ldh family oxidoreductase [Limnochorda sp. L945t]
MEQQQGPTRFPGAPPEPGEGTERRISAASLHEFCRAAFEKAGLDAQSAAIAASVLVKTSLWGIDTHGVALLPGYVKRLRDGTVKARPELHLTVSGASTAVLDADRALGVVAAYRAMEQAIDMARQSGVALVGVRRSTHFGAGAFYAMMALAHDMIGVAGSNGPAVMAPHGGARRAMHNMPLAAAVPALEEPPIVMDFAMSVVAMRRIARAAEAGESIPPGWGIDPAGRLTTDPRSALEGALLPLGYKTYALGILVDVLSGVLTGAGFGALIPPEGHDTGHFLMAIHVGSFMRPEDFKRRVDQLIRQLRSVPPQDERWPVRVPGEGGARRQKERLGSGIPVPAGLYERLEALARELGLAPPA